MWRLSLGAHDEMVKVGWLYVMLYILVGTGVFLSSKLTMSKPDFLYLWVVHIAHRASGICGCLRYRSKRPLYSFLTAQ